jgi:trehalose synthase
MSHNKIMGKLVRVTLQGSLDLSRYREFDAAIEKKLRVAARPLVGKRILHINSTAHGGGVAELLQSQVRFEKELGIKSRWYTLDAPKAFFVVTKQIHDLLQGKRGSISAADRTLYREESRSLAGSFTRIAGAFKPDIIVLHDPQPLGLAAAAALKAPTIVRLHGDLLTPNADTLEFIRPNIEAARKVVVSNKDYLAQMPWLRKAQTTVIYPAIDPLSEKNRPLDPAVAHKLLAEYGVNEMKPMIAQVSRFDPWKDPLGVIRAYYLAKNKIPDLQLVLAGLFLAQDDPEAMEVFRHVQKHAAGDHDIFLFSDADAVRAHSSVDMFVSAVYTASTVMVQKSTREGFGLTMTEAMWKGKPLVAGATSGAKVQVRDGANGIIVSSPEEAARAIVRLMRDRTLRAKIGRAARATVRRKFLMPRFVLDNLKLYHKLIGSD